MSKIENYLFNIFLLFLIISPLWPNSYTINIIFSTLFLIIDILVIIKKIKKIKIDKTDIMLILLPLFYFLPIIFQNYSDTLFKSLYFTFIEFSITLTLLVLKRIFNKELINKALIILLTSTTIYFFISIFFILFSKNMMLIGIFSYFGDTYKNSIDRFYGTLDYCNTSALIFLISIFIALIKTEEEKENKFLYMFLLFTNFIGFISTFSKSLFFVFLFILAVLFVYSIIYKQKKLIKCVHQHLSSIIIPLFLIVSALRTYYITHNIVLFLIKFILALISYYFIYKLLAFLKKKSIILEITIFGTICLLIIKPIQVPLMINNIIQENDYIISDFILNEKKDYKIVLNSIIENQSNVKIQLCRLYVKDLHPTEEIIDTKNIKQNIIFNFKSKKNSEYYYLKLLNLDKKSNIKIQSLSINNKKYLINSFLTPYQIIHQLDLLKYDKESVNHRLLYYRDSLKILKKEGYIIGHSWKSFNYFKEKYKLNKYLENDPHSYLFQLLLDVGIFGIIYLIYLTVLGIKNIWKKRINFDYIIWFIIFTSCMIILPFDGIYTYDFPKIILLLSFLVLTRDESDIKYNS